MEQVYEKAELLMSDSPTFTLIKRVYDKKINELKNRKFKGLAIASYIVGGEVVLFSSLWCVEESLAGGIIIFLFGIAIILLGIKFTVIYNKNKKANR